MQLHNTFLQEQNFPAPVYDSTGLLGTKYTGGELYANSFDKIMIMEEWSYNETKDIILCKIPEAIIYKKKSGDKEVISFRLQF